MGKRSRFKKKLDKIIARLNEYIKNRIKTEVFFGLIQTTRRIIHYALKVEKMSSSTIDLLGKGVKSYRKWIDFQRTPENKWNNICSVHVKQISSFNVSKEEGK